MKIVVEIRCPVEGTYIQGPYPSRAAAIDGFEMIWPGSGDIKPLVLVRPATDDDLQVLEAP